MLQQNWRALKDVSEDFTKDKEIVMQAVKQNWCALQFASEDLKKDYEIVLAAIKGNGFEFRYASDDLRKDKHLLLEAAKQRLLLLASDPQRDDVKTILLKFNYTDLVSALVSIELKTNKTFVREVVRIVKTGVSVCSAEKDKEKQKSMLNKLLSIGQPSQRVLVKLEDDQLGMATSTVTIVNDSFRSLEEQVKNEFQVLERFSIVLTYFDPSLEEMCTISNDQDLKDCLEFFNVSLSKTLKSFIQISVRKKLRKVESTSM